MDRRSKDENAILLVFLEAIERVEERQWRELLSREYALMLCDLGGEG